MARLIDADELLKEWDKPINYLDVNQALRHYTWFQIVIDKQPTVDAVHVVHGHWERIPNTPTWKCSICGYEITGFIDRDGLTPMNCKVNYCSRCGAKMDESTQSNDSNTLDALGEKVKE